MIHVDRNVLLWPQAMLNKYKNRDVQEIYVDPSESIASSFLELLSKKSPEYYDPEETAHDDHNRRYMSEETWPQ